MTKCLFILNCYPIYSVTRISMSSIQFIGELVNGYKAPGLNHLLDSGVSVAYRSGLAIGHCAAIRRSGVAWILKSVGHFGTAFKFAGNGLKIF